MGRLQQGFEPRVPSWGQYTVTVVCFYVFGTVLGAWTHQWVPALMVPTGALIGRAIRVSRLRRRVTEAFPG